MNNDAASGAVGAGLAAFGCFVFILYLAVIVLMVVGLWKVFTKAGKPGWAAIVPIYNMIVLLEIAGRPLWWVILLFIPFVNIAIIIVVGIDVAKKFGRGPGYGIGLALLSFVFYPMLGFGKAKYVG